MCVLPVQKCRYCNKMFANNTYLHKHMEKRHPVELAEDGFEDFETGAPVSRRRETSPPQPQVIKLEAPPVAAASPPIDVRAALEPLLSQQADQTEVCLCGGLTLFCF